MDFKRHIAARVRAEGLTEEEIAAISQEISGNVSALQNQIYSLLLS